MIYNRVIDRGSVGPLVSRLYFFLMSALSPMKNQDQFDSLYDKYICQLDYISVFEISSYKCLV